MPRNPENPRSGVHQRTAGISHRDVMKGTRRANMTDEDRDEPAVSYGFADVRRACHAWLMVHDQRYRETRRATMPSLSFGSAE